MNLQVPHKKVSGRKRRIFSVIYKLSYHIITSKRCSSEIANYFNGWHGRRLWIVCINRY